MIYFVLYLTLYELKTKFLNPLSKQQICPLTTKTSGHNGNKASKGRATKISLLHFMVLCRCYRMLRLFIFPSTSTCDVSRIHRNAQYINKLKALPPIQSLYLHHGIDLFPYFFYGSRRQVLPVILITLQLAFLQQF